ncbi:hypothetical protein [Ilumatobacter nonamiensis]|uniref:hypothetical protein n=1 Tax=Ilumatobacter nonamiensis TaxID=467093 RepID=UPI000345190D|nr:hypothetical protein [Ilumatobacter nonamiensis]
MTELAPPGPQRLFHVDPTTETLDVIATSGLTICHCRDLAAAVLTAAAIARNRSETTWLVAPDRWTVRLDPADQNVTATGSNRSPIDAIRRVLTQLPPEEPQP